MHAPLLAICDLHVEFPLGSGMLAAVDGVDLDIQPGEIVGLVGESGCGKTVLSLSVLQLLSSSGRISRGSILLQGRNLLGLAPAAMRQVRGGEIAMIFQNPQASLNPVYSVGAQLVAVLRLHQGLSKDAARAEALRLLERVHIPEATRRLSAYPSELSGGMCQRVMIAMALACRPKLLIADEPTASLDVTIQAQIVDLLLELREAFGMAILFISHDLAVVARISDRIAVMRRGQIVEVAPKAELLAAPEHPYTRALLEAVPTLPTAGMPPPRRDPPLPIEGTPVGSLEHPSTPSSGLRGSNAFDSYSIRRLGLSHVSSFNHRAACLHAPVYAPSTTD